MEAVVAALDTALVLRHPQPARSDIDGVRAHR